MTIYKQAITTFGIQRQKLKMMEEMAELIKELSKTFQPMSSAEIHQNNANICEEIADVQIVLDQMKLLFPDWLKHQERKLKRLEEMVKDI